MQNVAAEHARGANLRQADLDKFLAEGVPAIHLAKAWCGTYSFVCRERVIFDDVGFEFERYVKPESAGAAENAFTFLAFDADGEPADIAAWKPPRLALWLNRVAMLGEEQLHDWRLDDALKVHADPLAWLRANRRGVVIVNHERAAPMLRNAGPLAVTTTRHARELRQQLTTPPPRIVVAFERQADQARAA